MCASVYVCVSVCVVYVCMCKSVCVYVSVYMYEHVCCIVLTIAMIWFVSVSVVIGSNAGTIPSLDLFPAGSEDAATWAWEDSLISPTVTALGEMAVLFWKKQDRGLTNPSQKLH